MSVSAASRTDCRCSFQAAWRTILSFLHAAVDEIVCIRRRGIDLIRNLETCVEFLRTKKIPVDREFQNVSEEPLDTIEVLPPAH